MSLLALLDAARAAQLPRVPLLCEGQSVGSVAVAHLPALRAWPQLLRVQADRVELLALPQRDAALAEVHQRLREQGVIRAWRNETFALFEPRSGAVLAHIERAASRFWGSLTLGAHATGFVRGADGHVAALWIARRSPHKATDPGQLDNLVGGGVPFHQTPHQALLREAWEEAGLTPEQAGSARAATVLELRRDIPEGFQHERLHSFEIELPAGWVPQNQDGEVAAFELMPPAQVLQALREHALTLDAALVTLDFLHRHGLLQDGEQGFSAARLAALAASQVGP
jgi:8-oxo-dGTP pyrophosphatase MutT (NUDIX family)